MSCPRILRNKKPEARVHQARPLHSEQLRAGQVRLLDGPIAIQGKIARRKVVEIDVMFQRLFRLCPSLLDFFVL